MRTKPVLKLQRHWATALLVAAASTAFTLGSSDPAAAKAAASANPIVFHDARAQAAELIRENDRITLTPAQEKIRKEALSSIAAPCCAEYSMATCCCPCNLARSTWGLSKVLITRHHANAALVTQAVNEWIAFINSGGFTGDACDTGGCSRAFEKNGCGGMDPKKLIAA
jgi:hypothetical protein